MLSHTFRSLILRNFSTSTFKSKHVSKIKISSVRRNRETPLHCYRVLHTHRAPLPTHPRNFHLFTKSKALVGDSFSFCSKQKPIKQRMIDNKDMNDLQLEDVEDYTSDYDVGYPSAENDIRKDSVTATGSRRSSVMALICQNKKIAVLLGLVVLITAAIIGIASSGGDSGDGIHSPIVLIDPSTLDVAVTGPLMRDLLDLYDRHDMDPANLDPKAGDSTPERRAFFWLAHDQKQNGNIGHRSKMQRYAMAVFYYSTNDVANRYEENPKPWVTANLWMTRSHVCDWQGIICNEEQHITGIDMERNYLTGRLPMELKILSEKLTELNLASNLINMKSDSHYDVFKHLTSLQTLLMDDNFLEHKNGLPPQFRHMVKLEKLRLSYNLFQGQLDSGSMPVFPNLNKLTHLEIESNFLTGTVPEAIGNMERLVYIYLRRNNMEFNLDWIKSGMMKRIFALWLDSNVVKGTIPTEVGLLTNLASLSITNSTLTGTIPTEMGKLTSLRRLWLYGNQLTGDIPAEMASCTKLEVMEVQKNELGGEMPGGVCDNINDASYEYKSLVSDCSGGDIKCKCCTKCY